MTRKPLTSKDIKKAAKFTKTERARINDTLEALMEHEPRNIVLMGLSSPLIGVVVFCSNGTLSKELVSDLVLKGVEV